ncbi:MAG TPA: nucleotidyltransferase domain-containing protein [Candidatus Woesebacteria bacterium]|nr:nucleotidyltransferase domain-containing protein [Candidatus Woesebacteria bacterium]
MSILTSIKKTIKYSQKHGGFLTKDQLFERLISNKIYKRKEIYKLIKLKVYQVKSKKILEDKIKKATDLAKIIDQKFKDILFLGITGSVAAGYPKKNDDIDIVIITKKNKLWINRLKLRFFIVINKIPHRKFGKKEKKDEFCFNLWLDEKALEIKDKKQNLKNAMDLILIRPLINKNKTYEKFIYINDWAKKWVATGYNDKVKKFINLKVTKSYKNIFDMVINWLVFWPQFWYMKKKMKKEKVNLHQAFFHR